MSEVAMVQTLRPKDYRFIGGAGMLVELIRALNSLPEFWFDYDNRWGLAAGVGLYLFLRSSRPSSIDDLRSTIDD